MQWHDSGASAVWDASLVLALGLWLASLVPQWVPLLLGMKHLTRLRQAVARHFGLKLLAAGSWMAAIMLAMIGTGLVCRDLLGPERLGAQRIVWNATLVQEGLLIVVGVVLLANRRRAGPGAPAPAARRKPTPRVVLVVLLAWVAFAGVLVAQKVGLLPTPPSLERSWLPVAYVCVMSATLVVVLVLSIRDKRKSDLGLAAPESTRATKMLLVLLLVAAAVLGAIAVGQMSVQ